MAAESPYPGEGDFLFACTRLKGKKPLSPDTLLKKIIRPALKRAGITGKVIGWHSFRHSLATKPTAQNAASPNAKTRGRSMHEPASAYYALEVPAHLAI